MIPKGPPIGDQPPVIDSFYASPTVGYGQTWKIFIRAHDPDGDMWEVRFRIEQPGVLYEPLMGDVILPRKLWKEMDGYFFLHNSVLLIQGGPLDLVLSLDLADRGERKSRKIKMPLHIGTKSQRPPPEGFSDRPLLAVPYSICHTMRPPIRRPWRYR